MLFQRHFFYSQPTNRVFWTSNNVAGIVIKFFQQMLQAKMPLTPRNNNFADICLKRLQCDSCCSAISVHMGDTVKSNPKLFYWEIDFMEADFTAFRPVFCKWNVWTKYWKTREIFHENRLFVVSNTDSTIILVSKTKLMLPSMLQAKQPWVKLTFFSAPVACSLMKCCPTILGCGLPGLLYCLGVSLSNSFFSFPLYSAHFKHFWKEELLWISSKCR